MKIRYVEIIEDNREVLVAYKSGAVRYYDRASLPGTVVHFMCNASKSTHRDVFLASDVTTYY